MRNGLYVLQLTGNYYGRAVTKIAYVRRVAGDEHEILPGSRIIYRVSGARHLEHIAADGPKLDHKMFDASAATEIVHRLTIRRVLVANETEWAKHIERPANWIDAE